MTTSILILAWGAVIVVSYRGALFALKRLDLL